VVILPFPEAAADVDSVSDWHFAEAIAARPDAECRDGGKPVILQRYIISRFSSRRRPF